MNEIEDFFNSIGLKVAKQWRGEFSVYCPWHPDSNASLYVNPVKGLYHCFAGCVKGSKGLGPLLKKLGSGYDIQFMTLFPYLSYYEEEDKQELVEDIGVNSLPYASINNYLSHRFITEETVKEFNIRYHAGFDALVLPINDKDGQQVGYVRRNLSSEPKYMNSKGLDVSSLVFPWDKLETDDRPIVIVEGLFDAIRSHQEGYKAIATLGGEIKRKQLRIIGEYGSEIVLCPDKDKEALRIAEKNIELLESYGFSVSLTKPPGAAKDLAEARSVKLEIVPKYVLNFSQKSLSQYLGVV